MARIRNSISFLKNNFVETPSQLGSALFCPSSQDATNALFAPLHYEAGYAYPLIVWLHGRGSSERQLRLVMPMISMQNYVAVAPRGVLTQQAGGDEMEIYDWPQNLEQIQQAEQHVFDAIDAASQRFNISKQRIFLAGFDNGGTMAFQVALSHPQHFAGILSLCGSFPNSRTPLTNLSLARKLPIFLSVGRDSQKYPAGEVCENLRLLHTAGMSITLRQYPCGHELTPQMLGDVDRWIIEQITSPDPMQTASSQWPCEAE